MFKAFAKITFAVLLVLVSFSLIVEMKYTM